MLNSFSKSSSVVVSSFFGASEITIFSTWPSIKWGFIHPHMWKGTRWTCLGFSCRIRRSISAADNEKLTWFNVDSNAMQEHYLSFGLLCRTRLSSEHNFLSSHYFFSSKSHKNYFRKVYFVLKKQEKSIHGKLVHVSIAFISR